MLLRRRREILRFEITELLSVGNDMELSNLRIFLMTVPTVCLLTKQYLIRTPPQTLYALGKEQVNLLWSGTISVGRTTLQLFRIRSW